MRWMNRWGFVVGMLLLMLVAAACQSEPVVEEVVETAVPTPTVPEPTATPEPEKGDAELLLGVWSGRLQTPAGFVYPSEWEFREDGTMLLTVLIDEETVNLAYVYYFDPDGALRLDGQDGSEPGRREVFFENDDTVRLVAVRDGIVTLLLRGPLEDADAAGLQEVVLR